MTRATVVVMASPLRRALRGSHCPVGNFARWIDHQIIGVAPPASHFREGLGLRDDYASITFKPLCSAS